jgi:hypothetical protein
MERPAMAVFELGEDLSAGKYVRARAREFEEKYRGSSTFLTDLHGMWDFRITYGERTKGVAYISAPDAGGRTARIRWPGGEIDLLLVEKAGTLDGFVLSVLKLEEGWLSGQGDREGSPH